MTLGSHQRTIGKSQVHLTPKAIVDALGPFDLDPCAATVRPWDCAVRNIVEAEDGLSQPWKGLVWLNPPFDTRQIGRWISAIARHGNGILLVHARVETRWFAGIWQHGDVMLFLHGRVRFCQSDGSTVTKLESKSGRRIPCDSGAPVVLVAFGPEAVQRLRDSGLPGAYVTGWSMAA